MHKEIVQDKHLGLTQNEDAEIEPGTRQTNQTFSSIMQISIKENCTVHKHFKLFN